MTAPAKRTVQIDADDLERLAAIASRPEEVSVDEMGLQYWAVPPVEHADRWFVEDMARAARAARVAA